MGIKVLACQSSTGTPLMVVAPSSVDFVGCQQAVHTSTIVSCRCTRTRTSKMHASAVAGATYDGQRQHLVVLAGVRVDEPKPAARQRVGGAAGIQTHLVALRSGERLVVPVLNVVAVDLGEPLVGVVDAAAVVGEVVVLGVRLGLVGHSRESAAGLGDDVGGPHGSEFGDVVLVHGGVRPFLGLVQDGLGVVGDVGLGVPLELESLQQAHASNTTQFVSEIGRRKRSLWRSARKHRQNSRAS